MAILNILGIILVLVSIVNCQPTCHLADLWECEEKASEYLDKLPKKSIPHTEDQVAEMCEHTEKAFACARNYTNNCMTQMQRELVTFVTEGMIAGEREFCDANSEIHKKYLEHAPCLNEVSQMDEVTSHLEYILAAMESASTVPRDQQIVYACCGYAKTYDAIQKLATDNCGQEATDAMEEIISSGFSEIFQVICSGFHDNDERCVEVLPPDGTKPTGDVKSPFLEIVKEQFRNWLD